MVRTLETDIENARQSMKNSLTGLSKAELEGICFQSKEVWSMAEKSLPVPELIGDRLKGLINQINGG